MECDAQIYTIAVSDPATRYAKPMARMEEQKGLLFLDELSAKTGGIAFVVHERPDIAGAAASIARALRNQYTIGYAPLANSRNSQWRRIKVTVGGQGMKAYARGGYRLD
jgi:VWFA-related protein